ncbi:MAG TPA: hypothetical protein VGL47_20415 [Amycolatopsis sp.]|uniref:hypothetical protein n=1 Tax=Amycolatopsis sp. TaxID=37632 RepID=UPI002F42EB74
MGRKYGHLVEQRALASAQHLVRNLHRVPVLAIPCLIGRPPADAFSQSAYSAPPTPRSGAGPARPRSRQLDLRQVSLLAVAHTTQRDFRPAARAAVEDITYFDAWGRTGSLG